jgi:hypothetical protein
MNDFPQPVVAIPLAGAALCLSCEGIFYLARSNRCPLCADEHFVMVERFIGTIVESRLKLVADAMNRGEDGGISRRARENA